MKHEKNHIKINESCKKRQKSHVKKKWNIKHHMGINKSYEKISYKIMCKKLCETKWKIFSYNMKNMFK